MFAVNGELVDTCRYCTSFIVIYEYLRIMIQKSIRCSDSDDLRWHRNQSPGNLDLILKPTLLFLFLFILPMPAEIAVKLEQE